MSKVPRYLNFEDMNKRIGRTIIRYRNEFVYAIPRDERTLSLDLMNIHSGETHTNIDSSDIELNVNAFPLGYSNKYGIALFTARMPVRINRQGLCSENALYYNRPGGNWGNVNRTDLATPFFFDMLNNKYPSFENALKAVSNDEDTRSIAIAKKIALERTEIGLINLIYFTTPVAVYDPRAEIFKVTERFSHYLPLLRSQGINVEAI